MGFAGRAQHVRGGHDIRAGVTAGYVGHGSPARQVPRGQSAVASIFRVRGRRGWAGGGRQQKKEGVIRQRSGGGPVLTVRTVTDNEYRGGVTDDIRREGGVPRYIGEGYPGYYLGRESDRIGNGDGGR